MTKLASDVENWHFVRKEQYFTSAEMLSELSFSFLLG